VAIEPGWTSFGSALNWLKRKSASSEPVIGAGANSTSSVVVPPSATGPKFVILVKARVRSMTVPPSSLSTRRWSNHSESPWEGSVGRAGGDLVEHPVGDETASLFPSNLSPVRSIWMK
jgi:hypothetical protein